MPMDKNEGADWSLGYVPTTSERPYCSRPMANYCFAFLMGKPIEQSREPRILLFFSIYKWTALLSEGQLPAGGGIIVKILWLSYGLVLALCQMVVLVSAAGCVVLVR